MSNESDPTNALRAIRQLVEACAGYQEAKGEADRLRTRKSEEAAGNSSWRVIKLAQSLPDGALDQLDALLKAVEAIDTDRMGDYLLQRGSDLAFRPAGSIHHSAAAAWAPLAVGIRTELLVELHRALNPGYLAPGEVAEGA